MFGQTDALADIIAPKLQSMVGKFLQMKEELINLKKSSDVTIQAEAEALMADQDKYQAQMDSITGNINRIKAGNWTMEDIVKVAPFFYNIDKHNKNVEALKQAAAGIPVEEKMNWMIPGAIVALGLFFVIRKRR
jgi:predicted nuclease with TOPRIM domain